MSLLGSPVRDELKDFQLTNRRHSRRQVVQQLIGYRTRQVPSSFGNAAHRVRQFLGRAVMQQVAAHAGVHSPPYLPARALVCDHKERARRRAPVAGFGEGRLVETRRVVRDEHVDGVIAVIDISDAGSHDKVDTGTQQRGDAGGHVRIAMCDRYMDLTRLGQRGHELKSF